MAQKPDFMKAVKQVGHQMKNTARQNADEHNQDPHPTAQTPQGSERAGDDTSVRTSRDMMQIAARVPQPRTTGTRVPATIYMDQQINKRLKILAAIEGNRLNDYFLEALDDYIAKIGDRLPKL